MKCLIGLALITYFGSVYVGGGAGIFSELQTLSQNAIANPSHAILELVSFLVNFLK
jgi:hypothetical protein